MTSLCTICKYLLLIAFLSIPLVIYGQKQRIEGVVTDNLGLPVSEVKVGIKIPNINTLTDNYGYFQFSVPNGTHSIQFEHISFEKRVIIYDTNKPERLQISLQPKTLSLTEVVISAKESSTSPSFRILENTHKQIAGSTSIAVMQPEIQRLETLKDALQFNPGVMIQESFGANDLPRLSIRGSGIQSNPQRRGVYLSQDGIPTNFADGSYSAGSLDPATAQYVEVLKGANSLRYGAATLGGAINFISHTGINSPGIYAKTEFGSHDYYAGILRYGASKNKWDFSSTLSAGKQHGFRQHNKNEKFNLLGNVGYKFNEKVESRLYLSYSYNNFDIPGPLTLKAIAEDPSQVNPGVKLPYTMGPNILRDKPKRELSLFRIANRTAIQISDNSKVTFSPSYQYADDRFVFPIVLSTQHSFYHDFGLKAEWNYCTGSHDITSGILGSYGYIDRRGHINKDGLDSYMFSWDHLYASNISFYAEDNWKLSDRLRLVTNLQIAYNRRDSKDVFPFPDLRPWYSHSSHKYRYFYSENISKDQSFFAINPRIGVIYDCGKNKDIQVYFNLSQSYEPPTFDELVGTAVTENINTSPKDLFMVELDKQTASTIELGTRHKGKRFAWDLTLYHSWVKDELLEVKDFVQGVKKTRNYPDTQHSGIELGISYIPFSGIFSDKDEDKVSLKGVYNYSRFRFTSGEYKGNRLAGIPRQFLTGELEYRYHGLLSVAINAECLPESTPVDHTNTLNQPSYSIFGFRVGIEKIKNCTFYLEGKNIFNKYYASSYVISDQIHQPAIPFPDFTSHNMAFFMPGPTRAFYIGFSYKFN